MALYTPLSRLIPRKTRQKFKEFMDYSTIHMPANDFLGLMVLGGIFMGSGVAFAAYYFEFVAPLLCTGVFFAVFLLTVAMFYMRVSFSIDSKTKAVEEALPDALQLMSSNIRAGLTTDKALLLAARPEFGPLSEELRRVGRETMTGRNFAYALKKTTKRIKSESLSRTIDLIVNSLKSGGKLADLLDQTASDLRDQDMIKKEISAGVLMYVIFIFVAIAFGAPLLFAMSSFLVKLLTKNIEMISKGMPSGDLMSGAPISMTSTNLDSGFISFFALVSLTVTSIFGAIIMGLILKGDNKSGLKYLPILLGMALALYFAGSYVMDSVFGQMMGM